MSLYTCLYAGHSSPSLRTVGRKPDGAYSRSVSGIADQRVAGPEQQHQQDTQHTHHGKHRLVQNDFDDAGPEPGRNALHPGPKRLLAGLVDIVPELTEPGEPQGLIGDPARAVIDHENESAGQQQQPYQSEKTADHASPYIARARKRSQPLERDDFSSNRHPALSFCLSMIFSENRSPLFRIMLWQPPELIPPPQAAAENLSWVGVTRDRRSCRCRGKARAPALPIPPCERPTPPARGPASAHIRVESCRRYPCRAPALPNLFGRQPASDGSGCSGWRGQCAGHRNGSAPIRGTAAHGEARPGLALTQRTPPSTRRHRLQSPDPG